MQPWLTSEQLCSGSGALAALQEIEAGDTGAETSRVLGRTEVPAVWELNAVSEFSKSKSRILVDYGVPGASSIYVRVAVYNINDQKIATLIDRFSSPGRYREIWDGGGGATRVSSGVYFVRLEAEGSHSLTKKVVFIR